MQYYSVIKKQKITLDETQVIGVGGEARVYAISGNESLVAKIYHSPTERQVHKLAAMIANPPLKGKSDTCIAWPMDLLSTASSDESIVGFLMPRATTSHNLYCCFNPKTRGKEFPSFTYSDLHHVAGNLAAAVSTLHASGYVIGDMNEQNVLVNQFAQVTLVDTDSFQVTDRSLGRVYRCLVATSGFTPPELQGKNLSQIDRSPEHDLFGLAILIFQLLMEGIHPFSGHRRDEVETDSLATNILAGYFPYMPSISAPSRISLPFEVLSPALQKLFLRCFQEGHDQPPLRPNSDTWSHTVAQAQRELIVCSSNQRHQYGEHLDTCPWCERKRQFSGYDAFSIHSEAQYWSPPRQLNILLSSPQAHTQKMPPESLVSHIKSDRCVLFVGSGLSAWAKMPTWKELLSNIVAKLSRERPESSTVEQLYGLLEAGRYNDVGEYCKRELGSSRFSQILCDQFRKDDIAVPEPHNLIAKLPFSAIVTTNYDKLLEQAYSNSNKGNLPRVPTHRDTDELGTLLFHRKFFILKAHGDIDRAEGMVFTTSDYRQMIHSNTAFNMLFSAILLTKAILFVGYSNSDPDFRLLLEGQFTAFKGSVPERYALMYRVSDVEQNILWETSRIQVIPYLDHPDILNFFAALQEMVGS